MTWGKGLSTVEVCSQAINSLSFIHQTVTSTTNPSVSLAVQATNQLIYRLGPDFVWIIEPWSLANTGRRYRVGTNIHAITQTLLGWEYSITSNTISSEPSCVDAGQIFKVNMGDLHQAVCRKVTINPNQKWSVCAYHYMYIYIYTHAMYVCIHMCVYHIYIYIHIYIYTYIYIYIHICQSTCTSTYIYIHIHTYIIYIYISV